MTRGRPAVRIDAAVKAYATLCRVYPPAFRDRFAQELEDDFRRSCEDAVEAEGHAGLYKVWAYALIDVLVNVPAAHLAERDTLRQIEHTRRAAYALMVVALPMLVLVRLLADSAPTDALTSRLAGLTMHCALVCGVSIVCRRFVGLALPILGIAVASLVVISARSPDAWSAILRTPMSTVLEALRISLPAALVVILVNAAPLIVPRQGVASSDPSTR
jgi:hypothetical protein